MPGDRRPASVARRRAAGEENALRQRAYRVSLLFAHEKELCHAIPHAAGPARFLACRSAGRARLGGTARRQRHAGRPCRRGQPAACRLPAGRDARAADTGHAGGSDPARQGRAGAQFRRGQPAIWRARDAGQPVFHQFGHQGVYGRGRDAAGATGQGGPGGADQPVPGGLAAGLASRNGDAAAQPYFRPARRAGPAQRQAGGAAAGRSRGRLASRAGPARGSAARPALPL